MIQFEEEGIRKINIELVDFNINGEVKVMFSELLWDIRSYNLNIDILNTMKSDIIDI